MSYIGILSPTASGHLNPMTTLGHELKQRGHQVTLFGSLDAQAHTLAADIDFRPIAPVSMPLGSTQDALARLGDLEGLSALKYTIELFKQGTIVSLAEAPEILKAENLDLLLIDQTLIAGGTIAEHLNIPFVTVCSALMLNRDPDIPPFNTGWAYNPTLPARLRNRFAYTLLNNLTKPIHEVVASYRQKWGLPAYTHPNEAYSSLAQLCQQPPGFEYPRTLLPKHFHFTGPYSRTTSRQPIPFPYEQLSDKPLIYASLGTVQNRLIEVFRQIADACVDLDVQFVISLGGALNKELLPTLSGSPLVVQYAPQLEILKRATLCITHAGMNTALECLAQGVPMVAIPIANDQPGVAARIRWSGTGEVIPLKTLTVDKLRQALTQVLQDPSYRQQALTLQKDIDLAGGVSQAAKIVEQVIATKQPVQCR
ncbi:MAG: glycosyltransferase [Acaryochloridaceae cyanobacterium CSU_3_4]|nr:glycosyltransferase [Acaryochloridaceae cyanobacterium CSU_3_4]